MNVSVMHGDDSVDLVGKAGETFRCWFKFVEEDGTTPVHLSTVATARLQVKARPEDSTAIFDLTLGNGLSFIADQGLIEVVLSDEQTADKVGNYVFDLRLNFVNGDTYYLVGGGHQLLIPVTK